MGNKNFGKYLGIFLITALLSVMVFSLTLPSARAAAGRVLGNNTNATNITTTAIPNTTSSIPQEANSTNATPHPPRATMYVVNGTTPGSIILNGGTQAGSNTTNVTGLDIAWGDGELSSGVFFPQVHTYTSPGTYTIDVTVLQSDGESSTLSTNATVGSAPSTINQQSTAGSTVPYSLGAGSSNTLIYVAVIVVVIIILLATWKMMGKK